MPESLPQKPPKSQYFCVDHYLEELVADLDNGRKGALR